ncbi:unnamed protein product [Adineta ricciae]|uniref:Uncharacterized protein n=1 Tax=Adineta ricciae TaxID=249248 RepID=A0A816EEX2_ADIRI|nr:unnamed protein product [Adineta ricciae]CAF1651826.1 unnamed protein product [Adineta ricciae]
MGNCNFKLLENSIPLEKKYCTHEGEDEKITKIQVACFTGDFDTIIDLLPQLCETVVARNRDDLVQLAYRSGDCNIVRLIREYQNSFWKDNQLQGDYENANPQTSVDRADIATYMRFISTAPFFIRPLIRLTIEQQCLNHFDQIVELTIQNRGDTSCTDLIDLWATFRRKICIKSLLRIYTLAQPPMSTIIQNKSSGYATLVYVNLHNIECRQRAFNGISYRGEFISVKDLVTYSGAKGKEALVEIKNFYSTSKLEDVALSFGGYSDENNYKFPALYVFDFRGEACSTAIDLVKEPVISKFPDEEEVLLLPYTMFRVVDVHKAGYTDNYGCNRWIINLKNIIVPKRNFMSFIWERTDLKNKPEIFCTLN